MRHAKQFFYGLFFLILWAGIGAGVYYIFVKPAPTCFDNIQNQNEAGIDCGGVCSKMCRPDVVDLTATNVTVLPLVLQASSTNSRASLFAQIANPNASWAGSRFIYTFNVYDAEKNLIGSFPGSSYIYAGEIKYIALPNVALNTAALPASADLTLEDPKWVKVENFAEPPLTVTLAHTDIAPVLTARGNIVNPGPVPVDAEIVVIFYDPAGNPVGISSTNLDRLTSGESREFAVFHPSINNVAPEKTRVFASAYTVQ